MTPQCRAVNLAVHALAINVDYKTVDLLQREQLQPEFVKATQDAGEGKGVGIEMEKRLVDI